MTALVVTYIAMAAEWKYQAIDHFSFWVRDMKTFVWYLLFIVTIGGSRCVLLCLLRASTSGAVHARPAAELCSLSVVVRAAQVTHHRCLLLLC